MADREEEDLQMALRMSLQGSPRSPPEPKRSKPPRDAVEESPEARNRRVQRELMAAAAERRIMASGTKLANPSSCTSARAEEEVEGKSGSTVGLPMASDNAAASSEGKTEEGEQRDLELGEVLSLELVEQLFVMLFGAGVSKDILAQWSNQGIMFSSDPETCIGLVQHGGGPCGVLAAIQAFALKYLLFFPQNLDHCSPSATQIFGERNNKNPLAAMDNFVSVTNDRKIRALLLGMVEILFLCGSGKKAIVATLNIPGPQQVVADGSNNEILSETLEGLQIESATDLHRVLRVNTYTSQESVFDRLMSVLPELQSRMGAMLFLISALLSRGLESIQGDRDDPSQPLVTAPFGHASQEIVNLLLCGYAAPNVFDGSMDLGGEMSLKGIPEDVEVGFLTLLESLNFCMVGRHLKFPRWPIWVVGSESHYTVLFALDTAVQDENELEEREANIRRAFDAQDQSGGGGFVSVEGFQQVIWDAGISLPPDKLESLCAMGFIVWSELWKALLELDRGRGGLKDPTGSMGRKQFDVYHFNGMAKPVQSGSPTNNEDERPPPQRPKLCRLNVSVPPKWTQEKFLADVLRAPDAAGSGGDVGTGHDAEKQPEPNQHAPLVDCIRTRWPRAACSWDGDAPSIV